MTLHKILLLMGLVALVYFPASQGDFIWDDDAYVSNNQNLRSAQGLWDIWFKPGATPQYYPLVFSSFWFEYHLWNLDPVGYHWVNVLFHGLNSVLLYLVLSRLDVPQPWLAAAIFALHPVHVESVAWITERKNVLSGFFYLSALLVFLRFAQLGSQPGPRSHPDNSQTEFSPAGSLNLQRGKTWMLGLSCIFLFLCALFSKTVTCSLPAVLFLILWWKRGKWTWPEIGVLAAMFVLGVVLALNTIHMEKTLVGAQGIAWQLSFTQRSLIAGRALWFYAGKLLWPHPLVFVYPRWVIDASQVWQYLYPAGAILLLVVLFFGRPWLGKGPLVACLIFAGTLFPALGFFDVYPMIFSFVADHFQYLASASLLALLVAGFHQLASKWDRTWNLELLAGTGVLALLACLTWQQCAIYRDLETLWQDTLTKNPASWLGHFNLGTQQWNLAQKTFAGGRPGDAAVIFAQAGHHFERAEEIYRRTFGISYLPALFHWGAVCLFQGKKEEGEARIQEALRLGKNDDGLHVYAGLLRLDLKDFQGAFHLLRIAVDLNQKKNRDQQDPYVFYHLGKTLVELGQPAEGIDHLRTAASLRPSDPFFRSALDKALLKK